MLAPGHRKPSIEEAIVTTEKKAGADSGLVG